jgi:hypothetical protein
MEVVYLIMYDQNFTSCFIVQVNWLLFIEQHDTLMLYFCRE